MTATYSYKTTAGTFQIVKRDGRWRMLFGGDSLGNYYTADQAADDLTGGHTLRPFAGFDPVALGIPSALAEWQKE